MIIVNTADRAGTVYMYIGGDEPSVAINLFRFVQSVGSKPSAALNPRYRYHGTRS